MDEILSEFIAETQESLEALTNVVVALEADPSDRALLDQLFRFFHTVKGSCSFLDLPRFERLSHAAEDVLSEIRSGESVPDAATISAVLSIMDRIGELCGAIDSGESLPDRNDEQLISLLLHCHQIARAQRQSGYGDKEDEEADAEASAAEILSLTHDAALRGRTVSRTVRLPLILIDQLMNGVSDMVLARNELARKLRGADVDAETEAAFRRLSASIADMRNGISKTRMQRVDRLFMAIPRMVRDLSRELGKTINLNLSGGDVEMDREMIEMVIDPLTHIVRNSIDHGIETPEERRRAGKDETGNLNLSAYQSGSQIVIEVVDDGRGIDIDGVTERAVAGGLITRGEAADMTRQEKLHLICAPGISTAAKVTAVSGRGVGMDIVRANVERIGGTIALASKSGKGLSITIRVPLTLTIIPGLILNAGGVSFAIPRSAVVEILHEDNPALCLSQMAGGMTATLRGIRYSLIDLENIIGLPVKREEGPRTLMLVRSAAGAPYILGVNHVEHDEELVIRPAAPIVMAAGIYAGMTLPDNGQPQLLLDAGGIAEVAGLPLVAETVDPEAIEDESGGAQAIYYTGLRFRDLNGKERVIRLSLVERVEEVPVARFTLVGEGVRVQMDGRLIPCVTAVSSHDFQNAFARSADAVTPCLRLCDGTDVYCYPVQSVSGVADVPADVDFSASYGIVAGLALMDGSPVEVIDDFALMASGADRDDVTPQKRLRCVISDSNDMWSREILAPLLMRAGYDVAWQNGGAAGAGGHSAVQDAAEDICDVLLLTGQNDAAVPGWAADMPVIRLRDTRCVGEQVSDEQSESICRYDKDALFGALFALRQERGAA